MCVEPLAQMGALRGHNVEPCLKGTVCQLLQKWHELVPYPVSKVCSVCVGSVFPPLLSTCLDKLAELGLCEVEQWAPEWSLAMLHTCDV